MPTLTSRSQETLRPSELRLDGCENSDKSVYKMKEENVEALIYPVISFFQVMRKRVEDRIDQQLEQELSHLRLAESQDDGNSSGIDDDDFLHIKFSTVDDVIEFYQSDDEDYEEDGDRIRGERQLGDYYYDITTPTPAEDDDAIVSSWIDNFHFLLVEQEKREQEQKKKNRQVRFESTAKEIDCSHHKNCDQSSLASSSCSSSTESTCRSFDTLEEQEFEEFTNQWNTKGSQRKNTHQSGWRRMLRDVIVGPSVEDFDDIHDNGNNSLCCDDEEEETLDGGVVADGCEKEGPRQDQEKLSTEIEIRELSLDEQFCVVDNDQLPNDLLFSIDNQ